MLVKEGREAQVCPMINNEDERIDYCTTHYA